MVMVMMRSDGGCFRRHKKGCYVVREQTEWQKKHKGVGKKNGPVSRARTEVVGQAEEAVLTRTQRGHMTRPERLLVGPCQAQKTISEGCHACADTG